MKHFLIKGLLFSLFSLMVLGCGNLMGSSSVPTAEQVSEAQKLPNEYVSEEHFFSIRYPENWVDLVTYETGDIEIRRKDKNGELTGGTLYITVYDDAPSDAPNMTSAYFGIETEKGLKESGWTTVKMGTVEKEKWQEGVFFNSSYEGIYDEQQYYEQEFYWENSDGVTRIIAVSFFDEKEQKEAQQEINQMIASLKMITN